MRLADLPSTRVIDGRRQTRRPVSIVSGPLEIKWNAGGILTLDQA